MVLWTIQPEEVYNRIMSDGFYRCNTSESLFGEYFGDKYKWMSEQMQKRIGDPPKGVLYPIWAWYQWEDERKKPDLRRERWGNGWKGDRFVCMEIDMPEEGVLLSDFDAWSIILNDGLLSFSEQEHIAIEKEYECLLPAEQLQFKYKNWERVFDLAYIDNDWTTNGSSIQGTFWELRKEQVIRVRFFTGAMKRLN